MTTLIVVATEARCRYLRSFARSAGVGTDTVFSHAADHVLFTLLGRPFDLVLVELDVVLTAEQRAALAGCIRRIPVATDDERIAALADEVRHLKRQVADLVGDGR